MANTMPLCVSASFFTQGFCFFAFFIKVIAHLINPPEKSAKKSKNEGITQRPAHMWTHNTTLSLFPGLQ